MCNYGEFLDEALRGNVVRGLRGEKNASHQLSQSELNLSVK